MQNQMLSPRWASYVSSSKGSFTYLPNAFMFNTLRFLKMKKKRINSFHLRNFYVYYIQIHNLINQPHFFVNIFLRNYQKS